MEKERKVAAHAVKKAGKVSLENLRKEKKVQNLERSEKRSRKIVLISVSLVVVGLFLPWAHWESYGDAPAGFTTGLETLDGGIDGWLLLLFGFAAGYLSLSKSEGLSTLFIVFLGLLIFLGSSLDVGTPWVFAPPELGLPWKLVSSGTGLYAEIVGGLVILVSGVFSLIQKERIKREIIPLPPY